MRLGVHTDFTHCSWTCVLFTPVADQFLTIFDYDHPPMNSVDILLNACDGSLSHFFNKDTITTMLGHMPYSIFYLLAMGSNVYSLIHFTEYTFLLFIHRWKWLEVPSPQFVHTMIFKDVYPTFPRFEVWNVPNSYLAVIHYFLKHVCK